MTSIVIKEFDSPFNELKEPDLLKTTPLKKDHPVRRVGAILGCLTLGPPVVAAAGLLDVASRIRKAHPRYRDRLTLSEWVISKSLIPAASQKVFMDIDECNMSFNWLRSRNYDFIETEDGAKLHTLFAVPLKPKETQRVVILFHMNAEYMDHDYRLCNEYLEKGYHVVKFDYRGVGKSSGKVKGFNDLLTDGKTIVLQVLNGYKDKKLGIDIKPDSKDIILHGTSIGGAVAAHLGANHPEMKLVCSRTFKSWRKAANDVVGTFGHSETLGKVARQILRTTKKTAFYTYKELARRFSHEGYNVTIIESLVNDEVLSGNSKLTGHKFRHLRDVYAFQYGAQFFHADHLSLMGPRNKSGFVNMLGIDR